MIEVVHLEGLPQVRKMLDQFEGQELQNKMRVAVRAGLKPFQKTLAFEGDTPGHPHSFTKVPAGKVTTRGGASGREIEGYVRPKSPLFNIFEPGASSHTIGGGTERQARSGGLTKGVLRKVRGGRRTSGMLSGPQGSASWDPGGRKRKASFFAKGPVTHPGMRARPILPAAFAAGEQAATDAIAKAIFHIAEASRRLVP
jgi:hypothetical protein